jgi:mRNA deadenylase 3'-5' endonuclease subunit Ccr4
MIGNCRGIVEPSHEAWLSMYRFSWQGSEHDGVSKRDLTASQQVEFHDSITPVLPTISHPLHMSSAAGFPAFTNYTRDFKMTLDYIFVDTDSLAVTAVAPLPTEEVLSEHVALPSIVFPSDHVSLIVDVDFQTKQEGA